MTHPQDDDARAAIDGGRAALGIELGSTRIKACLIDEQGRTLASGGCEWENALVDGLWTYDLDDVRSGAQAAFAELAADVRQRYGTELRELGSIGVSAMMHGYLAFDADGRLLVPFRTWRNVNTERAAEALSGALSWNMPLRWSAAHLLQAAIDREEHVASIARITTLSGYVHRLLTGEDVLGIGDASGMFPIDPAARDYDARALGIADQLLAAEGAGHLSFSRVLPAVRRAGDAAGALTEEGARLLDPDGPLRPGAVAAAPEGDAGTGMVATNAVTPRTGNVSAGTSIFAMVVLERPLARPHEEIDIVTTPAGDLVAMVHCNNGASELGAWAGVFREFARALGQDPSTDEVFGALFAGALEPGADDGILAYNHLSGEPIAGLAEGRPLIVRTPASQLTLPGLMRAQVRGAFATLSLGMRTLAEEDVAIDAMYAHGGMFRTAGVAQRLLADAVGAPVLVGDTAAEGGAWGMAVLAAFRRTVARGEARPEELPTWLDATVFVETRVTRSEPTDDERADHERYLARWSEGLAIERAATASTR
ncbi:FGGY-family carbohydrate kinase [Microbacterium sp. gxy059]|uniref:FGGY-family carbohydrate kinase n=1 Tax=Microbacterium sp. gxy059 TaxID=2957199 RepID=UPI003D987848